MPGTTDPSACCGGASSSTGSPLISCCVLLLAGARPIAALIGLAVPGIASAVGAGLVV